MLSLTHNKLHSHKPLRYFFAIFFILSFFFLSRFTHTKNGIEHKMWFNTNETYARPPQYQPLRTIPISTLPKFSAPARQHFTYVNLTATAPPAATRA